MQKNRYQRYIRNIIVCCLLAMGLLGVAACGNSPQAQVTLYGWGGDTRVNQWLDQEFIPYVQEQAGITVKRVPMNIDEILMKLGEEKQGSTDIDIIWLNGENFYNAMNQQLLHGPFVNELTNIKYLDMNNPTLTMDFGYATQGFEAPWGRAQFVFISHKASLVNSDELLAYAKANPGRLTYPEAGNFTGSAFLRTLAYDLVGYEALQQMPEDYDQIRKVMQPVTDYLNELKPYLWNGGKSYPKDVSQLDALYQEGTIDLTMDYNANKAFAKVQEGSFPATAKTFVFTSGTPVNVHFLAVAKNSTHVTEAMQVIDLALTPEMQISKANLAGWGDLPIINTSKISQEQQQQLRDITQASDYPGVILTPAELEKYQVPELPARLVTLMEKVWEDEVLFRD